MLSASENPWDTMIGLDHMTETTVTKANSGNIEEQKEKANLEK
jgi:hypothetical protein